MKPAMKDKIGLKFSLKLPEGTNILERGYFRGFMDNFFIE